MIEKTLTTLQGQHSDERVELVQVAEPGETPTLEIRLLRNAGELGWRIHKRIRMAAGQIPDLQGALNLMDSDARDTKRSTRTVSHLELVG